MNRDPHDDAVIEHFRRHGDQRPSAELDARILAAATAAARPRQSWPQRLHHWLFGAGSQRRWSVALAGVAVLGIGLNLTLRTFEETPHYPAPATMAAPAAPAMAPASPPEEALFERAERHAKSSAATQHNESAVAAMRKAAPVPPPVAPSASAAASAQADTALLEPLDSLMRLQELYQAGKSNEARKLRAQLQETYPQLNIDEELRRLGGKR